MRYYLFVLLFVNVFSITFLYADEPVNKVQVIPASLVSTSMTTNLKIPTLPELVAEKEALPKNTELDEATRNALDEHLSKSIKNIQDTQLAQKITADLVKELETAAAQVTELEKKLASMYSTSSTPKPEEIQLKPEDINVKIKEFETQLNTAKQNLQQISAEIERRNQRRPLLEDLRIKNEADLQDTTQQLTLPAPDGENAKITEARLQRLQLKQIRVKAEIEQVKQESKTYEGTQRLWTLKHDLAELQSRELEKTLQVYQKVANEQKKKQAEQEAQTARWQLAMSHDSVRLVAEKNSGLAEENTKLITSLQQIQTKLDATSKDLKLRQDDFTTLIDRAKASEFSPAIGVLLRNQKVSLPNRDKILASIQKRQADIATLNLNLTEWQIERKSIIDIRTATESVLNKLENLPENITRDDLEVQVQELLTARLRLLGDMLESGTKLLDLMVSLDSKEKQLLKQINLESEWLARQVLWVRSTNLLGTQPQLFISSAKTLNHNFNWQNISELIWTDFLNHTIWWLLAMVVIVLIISSHKKIKNYIREQGEIARRAKCTSIRPTINALLSTVLLSITLPLLVWCIGWRLINISAGETYLQALGLSLQLTSIVWTIFEFLKQVAQHDGLGAAHFGWSTSALSLVRKHLRMLSLILLPILSVLFMLEYLNDEDLLSSIGRVLFLTAIVVTSISIFQVFNPESAFVKALETRKNDKFFWYTRWFWISIMHVTPLTLAVISVSGYHYTATQLTQRVVITLCSAFIILFSSSFLARWLLTTYRDLAIRRGQERRKQIQQAAQTTGDKPVTVEGVPELGLLDINDQARRMLRWVTTVAFAMSIFFIWIDILPALGFLNETKLWSTTNSDATLTYVTAADVMVAILVGMLTLIASRNIPGLLEIAVWQRLPLDAGARYAASTLSRYVIVIVGMIYCCQRIGISWSSVQWLIAAMTVGLGFGLQEIFANFVSGIILLFERPIRVGDTVTIGNITGNVSRIQIRATTITDWDNKELIVPNREFVTGNLINWTLSNTTLRVVIKVGVVYGSDTKLVSKLMYKVAHEHPLTLKDPEPFVAFTEFGDSSLNFELRIYVNGLENFRTLKNDLHMKINELFTENHLEFAFPHQDINIRSLPEEFVRSVFNKASA